ncbi:MAG: iron-sulfur cluster assembly protein [Terracidiphilus sp.]
MAADLPSNSNSAPDSEPFREEMIWKQLKTVRDPEIPVNIVDLGLIYAAAALPAENGGKRIEVRMTLTAPGCSMSDVIKAEVERKLAALPEVREVKVEVVFDPPWDKSRMSEAAKLHLGFDSDFGAPAPEPGSFKILR